MISWLRGLLYGVLPSKPNNPSPTDDEEYSGHVMFPDEMCQPRVRALPSVSWEALGISEDDVTRCEEWRVKARMVSDRVPDELTPEYVRDEMVQAHKALERHGYNFEAPAPKVLRALRYRFKGIAETGQRVKLWMIVVDIEVRARVWRKYQLSPMNGAEYESAASTVREELKAK